MKANELRIGNLISDINGNLCLVKTIREDLIIAKYYSVGYCIGDEEQFNKVELTEELLLKFGFEEKSKSKNFYLGNFRFHISKPANYDGFIFCDGYDVITDRIKYVHQLQNLYFALIGEELILNN